MTAIGGLSSRELDLIVGVLGRHQEISGAILYGSRAKGTHRQESDVDLLVQGGDALAAASVEGELDELPLPYRFDVQSCLSGRSSSLLEDIRRTGIVVYGQWSWDYA